MLDELTRDTFTLMGLMLSNFGLLVLSVDKITESNLWVFLTILFLIATLLFGTLAIKGSLLLTKRGSSKLRLQACKYLCKNQKDS